MAVTVTVVEMDVAIVTVKVIAEAVIFHIFAALLRIGIAVKTTTGVRRRVKMQLLVTTL